MINATTCIHTDFIKMYFEIDKSFYKRNSCTSDSNWKLVNNLGRRRTIVLSMVDDDPVEDEVQENLTPDPLEDTLEEVEIKTEWQSDDESDITLSDIKQNQAKYTDIETNKEENSAKEANKFIEVIHFSRSMQTDKSMNKQINTLEVIPSCTQNDELENKQTKTQEAHIKSCIQPNEIIDKQTQIADIANLQAGDQINNIPKLLPEVIASNAQTLPYGKALSQLSLADMLQTESRFPTQRNILWPLLELKPLGTATATASRSQAIEADPSTSSVNKSRTIFDSRYNGKILFRVLTKDELNKAIKREKEKESFKKAKHKCLKCLDTFEYESSLDNHNRKYHKQNVDPQSEIVCDVCERVFLKDRAWFKVHRRQHFERYECVVCKEQSSYLNAMSRHYNRTHKYMEPIPLSFWCEDCSFGTQIYLEYKKHKRVHQKQCTICKSRMHVKRYKAHTETCKPENVKQKPPKVSKKKYQCDHCDMEYSRPASLMQHTKRKHTAVQRNYCPDCNITFKNETNYLHHINKTAKHVNKDDLDWYFCDYCDKKFRFKVLLESHILRVHLKLSPFKCNLCEKAYASRWKLRYHVGSMHKEKAPRNKLCHYCGKGFRCKRILNQHIRTHTGERPLVCGACGATFRQSAALYTHRRLKHNTDTRDVDSRP